MDAEHIVGARRDGAEAPQGPSLAATGSFGSAGAQDSRQAQRIHRDRRMLEALPSYDRPSPSLVERMTLPALLCLAWLLFELTANATLSVMIACLRFGWDDFLTALWVKRVDPLRARGSACFWFYVSSGVWKTALTPILVVTLVAIAFGIFSPREIPHDHPVAIQVRSAILVGLGASTLLVLLVVVAVAFALASPTRIWVHYDLHKSRRRKQWPPRWTRRVWMHDNRGRAILATALLFVTIGLPPLLFQAIIMLGKHLEIAAMLLIVFGIPIAATTTYASLRGRIFARRPWECWPESQVDLDELDWDVDQAPQPPLPSASLSDR